MQQLQQAFMILAYLNYTEHARHKHHSQGNSTGIHAGGYENVHARVVIIFYNRRHTAIHAESRHNRDNTGNNKNRYRLLKDARRQLAQKRKRNRGKNMA